MDLEIHVNDTITVLEKYQDLETKVLETLRNWQAFGNMTIPLTISVVGRYNNDPPSLKIKVSDSVDTKDIFGRR